MPKKLDKNEGSKRVETAKGSPVDASISNFIRNMLPVPNNVSSFILKQANLPVHFDNNSFSPAQKKIIYETVMNAVKRSGNNAGGTQYTDYKGVTSPETFDHIINELQKKNLNKAVGVFHGATEPAYGVASTLGRFSYGYNPDTKEVSVFDNYNFNNPDKPKTQIPISDTDKYKAYKSLRAELGKKDTNEIDSLLSPKYGTRFVINPQDTTFQPPNSFMGDLLNTGAVSAYKNGGNISNKQLENNRWLIRQAASRYAIDPDIMDRLTYQESGYNHKARSSAGALGFAQFTYPTAKQYGLTKNQLTSDKPEDRYAVADAATQHFKNLLNQNNGDYKLALAAYNGGQGAVNYVKEQTGNPNITGDDLMNFYYQKRQNSPSKKSSAWQNQTWDYVRNIANLDDSQFYGDKSNIPQGDTFRNRYYNNMNLAVPIPTDPSKETEIPIGTTSSPLSPDITQVESPWKQPTPVNIPDNYQNSLQPLSPFRKKTSLADRNRLGLSQVLPELATILKQPDSVAHFQYEPDLFQPYQVNFQDKLNQNNSTFKAVSQNLVNNPEALSVLSGQKYEADNQILGDQFRTNQGIMNDVYNKNIGILNDAQLKNLGLAEEQYTRQQQAIANTRAQRQQAATSIATKIGQHQQENNNIRLLENFSDYRPDKNMNLQYQGEGPVFDFSGRGIGNPANRTITTIDEDGNKTTKTVSPSQYEQMKQALELREKQDKANKLSIRKYGGLINKMK